MPSRHPLAVALVAGSLAAACAGSPDPNPGSPPDLCGNARLDPDEECDLGYATPGCTAACTLSSCGDGIVNPAAGEECDAGRVTPECDADCTHSRCGDGIVNPAAGEECDLGPENVATTTGTACGYGQTCTFCLQAACRSARVTGPLCGDGVVQGGSGEQCDNAASFACGTCDATCRSVAVSTAQGTIDVVSLASIVAGDTITIDDGISTTAAVLEFSDFDTGACTTTAHICVSMHTVRNAAEAAAQIRTAMSGARWTSRVTPQWSATPNPITLRHDLRGIYDRPIIVAPDRAAVIVEGMSGGTGCLGGSACGEDRDCVSYSCSNHVCN